MSNKKQEALKLNMKTGEGRCMPAVVPATLVRIGVVRRREGGHVGGNLGQRLLLEVRVLQRLPRCCPLVRVVCQQLIQQRQPRHRHARKLLCAIDYMS